jgi:UDP-glucose 4-epimerase
VAGRRVLITGVSSHVGTELARRLETDPRVEYLAGLDTRPPRIKLERLDFIDADIRNPVIGKLIPQTGVDTVLHNQIVRRPGRGMSAQTAHDINVIGSLQLLAACGKTESLRTIIIRGSAGIYGAEPAAPQFFTEEMTRLYPLRTRFQRDVGEIENYFETFSRRYPGVTCMVLRYQLAIGPTVDTQITRYLSQPVIPTYLGFDPRLQFIHEEDAVAALAAAIERPVRGAVNVAGEGTIGLTRLVRAAGKVTLPLPESLFTAVTQAGRRVGLPYVSPDFRQLLRFGRAVETRRLVEEVGFRPSYSTETAVRDYLRTERGRSLAPSLRHAVVGR